VKDEFGKTVVICGYRDTVSTDLQSYADEMIWINDFFNEIERAAPERAI
jgi:hypothetical protein